MGGGKVDKQKVAEMYEENALTVSVGNVRYRFGFAKSENGFGIRNWNGRNGRKSLYPK